VIIAMNVDANPKDKAMVSLVETRRISRVTRLRAGVDERIWILFVKQNGNR
jgi:hypothetical protein